MLFHDSTNLTDFRDHLASHLKRLQTSKKPMAVTQRGKIKGIMLSPRQYEALAEAAVIERSRQRLIQSLKDAEAGRTREALPAIKKLRDRYAAMATRTKRGRRA